MNDRKFKITIGTSRFDTNWKVKEFTWHQIKERLGRDNETGETLAQYLRMSKDDRDKIKDCGGFVGGAIQGRKRRKGSVICRSLVTLDLDHAEQDFWEENFTVFFDVAALVYSTHSYTPEDPRLRLVIPLDRDCTPEEYIAVARKVAEDIGIGQCDRTTYQPERLMYYPSHPRGASWVFTSQDGPFLSVDDTLARYADWRDVSQYPTGPDEEQAVGYEVKQVADPLEKPGVVGAFNRTYTISAAIDRYLSDVYVPAATEGRYTYAAGTSTAGAIVYNDDTILYSNHATDPAAGHACNAYDLVRIHKFADLDKHWDGNPAHRRPSEKAMAELIAADEDVSATLTRESAEACADDFAEIDPIITETKTTPSEPQNEATDGMLPKAGRIPAGANDRRAEDIRLERDKGGNPLPTIDNFLQVLEHDPLLRNLGMFNEFTKRMEVNGLMPWNAKGDVRRPGSPWSDADQSGFRYYCEKKYRLKSKDAARDAVTNYYTKRAYHPVREYLQSLTWDGTERIETLFIDYLGAEDTEYVRTGTRKMMVAGVARIMKPGCKWDYMITLTGKQGIGKSTLFSRLSKGWYDDSLTNVSTKDACEQVQGVWIVEMAELTATRKADVEGVKQFISRQVDSYRKAYGEYKNDYPRQCIFVGTTNDDAFLRDRTGNRRFWIVEVGRQAAPHDIWDELTPDVVDQMWAEALFYYKKGERLFLDRKMAQQAEEMQARHIDSGFRDQIINYLDRKLPPEKTVNEWYNIYSIEDHRMFYATLGGPIPTAEAVCTEQRDKVCVLEIMCELFGINPTQTYNDSAMRLAREIRQVLDGMSDWEKLPSRTRFGTM